MLPNNRTSIPGVPHHELPATRREFLAKSGAGFGAVAVPVRIGEAPQSPPLLASS